MPEYRTTKDIVVPKGTDLVYPAEPQKEAVIYAHAALDANAVDPKSERHDVVARWSIPLGEALKAGLVEEVK